VSLPRSCLLGFKSMTNQTSERPLTPRRDSHTLTSHSWMKRTVVSVVRGFSHSPNSQVSGPLRPRGEQARAVGAGQRLLLAHGPVGRQPTGGPKNSRRVSVPSAASCTLALLHLKSFGCCLRGRTWRSPL
jgi:hypothetical protein